MNILPWLPVIAILITVVLERVRFLGYGERRVCAVLACTLLLWFPLTVKSGFSAYASACLAVSTVLKITELFFTDAHASSPMELSRKEFFVRMLTYPDDDFMARLRNSRLSSGNPQVQNVDQLLRQEAFRSNAHLLMDAATYYILLNVLSLFLPQHPRQLFETHSRWDWRFWLFMHLCGWGSFLFLALVHATTMSLCGFFMSVKMKRMFKRPYIARSVRDMWSRRWNQCFKDQFYVIVFRFMHAHERVTHHQLSRNTTSMLAAVLTFLFSGLIQYVFISVNDDKKDISDYYALACFREYTLQSTLYFLVHAVLTTTEVVVQRRCLIPRIPVWISVIYVNMVMIATMPLFQGPYLRYEFYLPKHLPLPYFVQHGRYSHWIA